MGLSKQNQTSMEPMENQMALLEIEGRVIRHSQEAWPEELK